MTTLLDRITGALYGGAIGDAMGGPAEGMPPEKVRAMFGAYDCTAFLPFIDKGDPTLRKGDGRITDDTLMIEALIRAYVKRREHMDAYDFAEVFLPEMADTVIWLPEKGQEMPILHRMWWPERYPWIRLTVCNDEPRAAGRGNLINCGVAMYMMPVGAVNAGDPHAAYQEAIAFACAHNESYALEAGAVMAAACARAFAPDAGIANVAAAALELARDGTRNAIRAALQAVQPTDSLDDFISHVRAAVAPFDPRTGHGADDDPMRMVGVTDFGRPSRTQSIEELPVALAALAYGNGDYAKTLRAGVFYGRDCDSIAGMAGALFGGIYGIDALPADLCAACDAANRRDFRAIAADLHAVARDIAARDAERFHARQAAISAR